jgi:hypothetical protein
MRWHDDHGKAIGVHGAVAAEETNVAFALHGKSGVGKSDNSIEIFPRRNM